MIENPPLLTIRRNFPRPSAAELAAFAGSPTGHLVDSMNGRGALSYRIKPVTALGGAIKLKDELHIAFDLFSVLEGP